MFPLHPPSAICILLLLIAATVAAATCMAAGRRGYWAVLAGVTAIALAWPWAIVLQHHVDHYTIRLALVWGGGGAGAVIAGAVWGGIARRIAAGGAALAVGVLPSLAASAYMLDRQWVPDAPCAERALFAIGDLTLAVPRAVTARSRIASVGQEQAWEGFYGNSSAAKPDIVRLCAATSGGTEPLAVHHLWISGSSMRALPGAGCDGDAVPADRAAYCAAQARKPVAVLQLYARPDGLPRPSLSHFNEARVEEAVASGRVPGRHCSQGTGREPNRYCTVWHRVSPGVLAVTSSGARPSSTDAMAVADVSAVTARWLSILGAKEMR